MTVDYGVTSTGFVRKTLAQAIHDFIANLSAAIGVQLDTDPQGAVGQLAYQFMNEIAGQSTKDANGNVIGGSIWELAQQVYDSFDPSKAMGAQLDAISFYTGTIRKAASFSTFQTIGTIVSPLILTGTIGTIVPSGSSVSNAAVDVLYQTAIVSPAFVAPSAWGATNTIQFLEVRSHAGNLYVALQAGETDVNGPTSTAPYPSTITDGTVIWAYLSSFGGYAQVPAQATISGPQAGPAFSIASIATPVTGWQTVINPQDVLLGSNAETDAQLRLRRIQELNTGLSAIGAIYTAFTDFAGVTSVRVFANNGGHTDAFGRPAHSVEVLLAGSPDNASVAAALFAVVGGGIQTYGVSHTVNVTAEDGTVWPMSWSSPTPLNIYVQVAVYVDVSAFPPNGDAAIAALVVDWGNQLQEGATIRPGAWDLYFGSQLQDLPGVVEAITIFDTSPIVVPAVDRPASVDLVLDPRDDGVFDSTRTAVFLIDVATGMVIS